MERLSIRNPWGGQKSLSHFRRKRYARNFKCGRRFNSSLTGHVKLGIIDDTISSCSERCLKTPTKTFALWNASVRGARTLWRIVHGHAIRIPVGAGRSSRLYHCRQALLRPIRKPLENRPIGTLPKRSKDEGVRKSGYGQIADRAGTWAPTVKTGRSECICVQERQNAPILQWPTKTRGCANARLLLHPSDGWVHRFSRRGRNLPNTRRNERDHGVLKMRRWIGTKTYSRLTTDYTDLHTCHSDYRTP